MNENKILNNRRKMFVVELNRIMIKIEPFNSYAFKTSKNGGAVYCIFNDREFACLAQVDKLGALLKLEKQGDLKNYLEQENKTGAIKNFFGEINKQIIKEKDQFINDYREIIYLINAQMTDAVYGISSLNSGQLTVGSHVIHFSESHDQILQLVNEGQLELVLIELVQKVKRFGNYHLTPHFKNVVTEDLKIKISEQLSIDKRYVNFKKRIEKVNRTITPAVCAFLNLEMINRAPQNLKMTVAPPIDTAIQLLTYDTFKITYQVGSLLSATYNTLRSKYEIEINYSEIDNLLNICAYVESMPAEVFKFSKHYDELTKAHPSNCQKALEKAKMEFFKNTLHNESDQLPQLMLNMKNEPHYDYRFNGQLQAIAFTELGNPDIYKFWVDQLATDYKKLLEKYTKRADDLATRYKERLGNPINYPVVTLIRDHRNKGMSTFVDILRGSSRARILKKNYHRHPSYGSLKDFKREAVENVIRDLVKEGLIQPQEYVIKNLGTYIGYHLNGTISQHFDKYFNEVDIVKMNIAEYLDFFNKIQKITRQRLVLQPLEALSDQDVDKVIAFLKTVNYNADAEALLVSQLTDSMPVKWAPIFAMNGQMEIGKTAKLFKKFAEILNAKMIS